MTIFNREDFRTVLPQLEKMVNDATADLKKEIADLKEELKEQIKAVTFYQSGLSGYGFKDVYCNIPDGYEILNGNAIAGMYISGDANAYVTDRSVSKTTVQGVDKAKVHFYLYNPNGTTTLAVGGCVLFKKK